MNAPPRFVSCITSVLCFKAEWYQEEAGIVRTFKIYFYPDLSLEVFDFKTNKTFMRRTPMLDLNSRDFFIGTSVSIYGRQFDIIDYGDELTKHILESVRTRSFFLVKPQVVHLFGLLLNYLFEGKARVTDLQMVRFTPDIVRRFIGDEPKGDDTIAFTNELLAGQSIGMVVIANNILAKLMACQQQVPFHGEIHPALRKIFEHEELRRGIYLSPTENETVKDINSFFNSKIGFVHEIKLDNTTLTVVKPHTIKEGNMGLIVLDMLNRGFKINALRMLSMERVNCEEFYDVYRGILPEYIPMVAELASGVCVAMEIGHKDPSVDTHKEFREFCGPMDPEVAKLLRPDSLRAKYGWSKVKNAVHCTDLREDAILEVQYFFKVLVEN